jgi:hypothetical protein
MREGRWVLRRPRREDGNLCRRDVRAILRWGLCNRCNIAMCNGLRNARGIW